MKHGYLLLSKDKIFGEISFGSFSTLREAKRKFTQVKKSVNVGDFEKSHLRLVELVEREISVDN